MSIQDTEQVIMNITMDMAEDPEGVYNDVMELIREEAIEKKIEYDGYYRIKWEEEAENVMTFDKEYFENKERRDLYVFKAALDDKEIFQLLHGYYLYSSSGRLSLSLRGNRSVQQVCGRLEPEQHDDFGMVPRYRGDGH
ncbi:hypothetical protein [Chryseobacterium mulctrae]|uniref:hypothetical protein n=1 Tax=Chryseobacterium mulctrae TaxID=2576777 RepID=UPI0021D183EB|nr:hypothetical protein [Chryseobacterium mulctrae]